MAETLLPDWLVPSSLPVQTPQTGFGAPVFAPTIVAKASNQDSAYMAFVTNVRRTLDQIGGFAQALPPPYQDAILARIGNTPASNSPSVKATSPTSLVQLLDRNQLPLAWTMFGLVAFLWWYSAMRGLK
jgi:hypothetical protein